MAGVSVEVLSLETEFLAQLEGVVEGFTHRFSEWRVRPCGGGLYARNSQHSLERLDDLCSVRVDPFMQLLNCGVGRNAHGCFQYLLLFCSWSLNLLATLIMADS